MERTADINLIYPRDDLDNEEATSHGQEAGPISGNLSLNVVLASPIS